MEFLRSLWSGPAGGGSSNVEKKKRVMIPAITSQSAAEVANLSAPSSFSSPTLLQNLRAREPSTDSTTTAAAASASGDAKAVLRDVAASDYPTPQKYLDDPEKIPKYYVFQSNMVTDEDLQPGMLRNLEVDKRLTLPTRTHIRFLITATDVIHSWAVPALGIKADAIPGRLQRIHTFIQREGVFYGQCSELCGALHGFMPIVIEAVSPENYAAHAKKWYKD